MVLLKVFQSFLVLRYILGEENSMKFLKIDLPLALFHKNYTNIRNTPNKLQVNNFEMYVNVFRKRHLSDIYHKYNF